MYSTANLPISRQKKFYNDRVECLAEPEPWRARIIYVPYPYYGIALFILLGQANRLEKPIANAILLVRVFSPKPEHLRKAKTPAFAGA